MNKFICVFLISVGLIYSALQTNIAGIIIDSQKSDLDRVSDNFLLQEGKLFAQKYNMQLAAMGGGAKEGKIWLMTLSFHRSGPKLSEKELRQLIVNCITDFLKAINQNEELKPWLAEYPFTPKNLRFSIINYDVNGESIYDPYFEVISWNEKKLCYYAQSSEKEEYGYTIEKYETFEEALAILQKE